MNAIQIRELATATYAQCQQSLHQWKRLGGTAPAHLYATVDDLVRHITRCEEIGGRYHVHLAWQHHAITETDTEIEDAAAAKATARKRSAGARALKLKYGKNIAEDIIQKHTGKTIHLRD